MSKHALAWAIQIGVVLLAAAIYVPAMSPCRSTVCYHKISAAENADVLRDALGHRRCKGLALPTDAATFCLLMTESSLWAAIKSESVVLSDGESGRVTIRWGVSAHRAGSIEYRWLPPDSYVLTVLEDPDADHR